MVRIDAASANVAGTSSSLPPLLSLISGTINGDHRGHKGGQPKTGCACGGFAGEGPGGGTDCDNLSFCAIFDRLSFLFYLIFFFLVSILQGLLVSTSPLLATEETPGRWPEEEEVVSFFTSW